MNRTLTSMMGAVAVTALFIGQPLEAASAPKQQTAAGRYQLVAGFDGTIYVIDTETGQCWSKAPDGRWVDEGNPTRPQRKRRPSPLSLDLPQKQVELTVIQRRSKPIPGSSDRILLELGDITAGQVLLSVRSEDGDVLLDDTSVKPGDVVQFSVADETFYVRVRELTNVLLGDDFGTFEISSSAPEVKPAKRGRAGDKASDSESEPVVAGVVTRFKVTPTEVSHNDTLQIEMEMTNVTSEPVRFRYCACIEQHIDLFDSRDQLVPWKNGAPIPECPYLEVEIAPGTTVKRSASFEFGQFYAVAPGEYEMRFKYDKRLATLKPSRSRWTWIPWSRKGVKIAVKGTKG